MMMVDGKEHRQDSEKDTAITSCDRWLFAVLRPSGDTSRNHLRNLLTFVIWLTILKVQLTA